MDCIFCNKKLLESSIYSDDYVYVLNDIYPVSEGHSLIITRRHVDNYFELNTGEKKSIDKALQYLKELFDEKYSPDGYNIGTNIGKAAGEVIHHVHIHLIPRYAGDMKDPTGGVRGVIPSKQKVEI